MPFSICTASTSAIRNSVPSDVSTFLVVSSSLVTNRKTLGPSVSMTESARISTFSWARAEQILARRPGLFSRNAVTSCTNSMEVSSFVRTRSPRRSRLVNEGKSKIWSNLLPGGLRLPTKRATRIDYSGRRAPRPPASGLGSAAGRRRSAQLAGGRRGRLVPAVPPSCLRLLDRASANGGIIPAAGTTPITSDRSGNAPRETNRISGPPH